MVVASCPRCDGEVGLHDGRPVVGQTGVVLWHARCYEQRATPYVAVPIIVPLIVPLISVAPLAPVIDNEAVIVDPPIRVGAPHSLERGVEVTPRIARPRSRRRLVAGTFATAVATIAIAFVARASSPPSAAMASLAIEPADDVDLPEVTTTHEPAPGLRAWVPTAIEAKYPMTSAADGTPLDDKYPSLRAWIHPVTHSAELVPTQPSRLFGVSRIGVERAECGAGHCWIDLDAPRGRALVAVADGTAVRVERHEDGIDHRSGRYIRIQHDDGTFTAYMHMDDVAEIAVGDHVTAGQYVGTLGATAVFSAPPHLHFQLEVPAHPGAPRGDSTDTLFVDPAPFLARATIIKLPSGLDEMLEPLATPTKPRRDKRPLKPSI
ncbi:MAG: M23 family metallopeptidase [Proteobacteria bacterium]|nr:M23 family metallopeptidase [Pseudomonadota bacterium]